MNRIKVTATVKETLVILLKNKIPLMLIAKILNIAKETLWRHTPKEFKQELKDFKEGHKENKLHLLQLYAFLLADEVGCVSSIGTPAVSKLKRPLYVYLNLKEWERFIDGVITYKNLCEVNTFADDVNEGYRKIIEMLYPSPFIKITGKEMVKKILESMYKEEIPFPDEKDINNIKKILSPYIEKELITGRENRYFDSVFILELEKQFKQRLSIKETECIKAFFGLSEVATKEFAVKYDLTAERCRQIMDKAIRKISSVLEGKYGCLSAKNISDYIICSDKLLETKNSLVFFDKMATLNTNSLQGKLRGLSSYFVKNSNTNILQAPPWIQKVLKEEFPDIASIEDIGNKPLLEKLDTPIEDLELSVRAYNSIKDYGKINTLGGLARCTPEQMMKWRNFGKYSLAEVEQILHERGLEFGMIF